MGFRRMHNMETAQQALDLLDHVSVGVFTLDQRGAFTGINAAALDLIGYGPDEVLGRDMHRLIATGDDTPVSRLEDIFLTAASTGQPVHDAEMLLRTSTGETLYAVGSAVPLRSDDRLTGALVTLQDGSVHRHIRERLHQLEHEQAEVLRQRDAAARIERDMVQETASRQRELTAATERAAAEQLRTQQREAEDRLMQSEKLAAVGRLAASISHEINNPLEAVTNLLYLVKHDPSLSEEACEYLKQAEEELARVSQIVSQTLRFQRSGTKPVAVGPDALIQSVMTLHQGRLHHKRVRIDVQHRRRQEFTLAEGDVRQILNNLVGNAIDAMSTQGGGTLTVRTAAVRKHPVTGQAGLRITVSDTGGGMDSQTASRIFEPFYTTKGSSGSGLGLWISGSLAKRHGGRLAVRSRTEGKRRGTTFSLFLPELSAEDASDSARAA